MAMKASWLSGEKELLAILSGRESAMRSFDNIVKLHGDDPDNWMEPLLREVS